MSKQPILSEFLIDEQTQIRVFDMGRRINKIPLSEFQKFERGETAYPYPFQHTAWLAILFWQKQNPQQHNIWFIRSPLDETGYIQLSARDEFMHLLMSRIGEQITSKAQGKEELTHALKDNPYVFKPTMENMAVFHSKAGLVLGQPPSQYFEAANDYLHGTDLSQWQELGIQGIADVVVRWQENDINRSLRKTLAKMPDESFSAFCLCLENEAPDAEISQCIVDRVNVDQNNSQIASHAIRALSGSLSTSIKENFISKILSTEPGKQAEVLVAISAKNWEVLKNPEICQKFIENLAQNHMGQDIFNAVISDLMCLPGLRAIILTEFRKPERNESVSMAVGEFFKALSA